MVFYEKQSGLLIQLGVNDTWSVCQAAVYIYAIDL